MSRYDGAGDDRGREALDRRIDRELRGQMLPTWELVWRGVDLLRSLPEGGHVPERWAYNRRLFAEYATYLEEDSRPQARRDHTVGAARRLARMEETMARYDAERAFCRAWTRPLAGAWSSTPRPAPGSPHSSNAPRAISQPPATSS
ncbi:hypothetical protein [Streptomyces hirsutus]|uniref:hypothetical protein n=1 Tax=Streptomyces hirsutus TaxID=35620 RepID=UPI00389B2D3B